MAGASSTHNKEEQEVAVVLLPHALVEPRAVVIEPRHAHVAHPAVLRPRRPEEKKTGKPKKKKRRRRRRRQTKSSRHFIAGV